MSVCGIRIGLSLADPDYVDRLPGATQSSTETRWNTTALSLMTITMRQKKTEPLL